MTLFLLVSWKIIQTIDINLLFRTFFTLLLILLVVFKRCTLVIIVNRNCMNFGAQGYQILPNLNKYHLSYSEFWDRFQVISRVEDPYLRLYTICKDHRHKQSKVAVKDYAAAEADQEEAVLENLQSYRKLGEVEGICKLVAFCKNQQTGDIAAAFQFDQFSLQQLHENPQFKDNPQKFYLIVLRQMLKVMDNAKAMGIELEELIPSNILFYTEENQHRLKILYDERQKNYQKIQEGIKVYSSAERVQAAIEGNQQYQIQNCEQAIFQLGLLLLDLIYECQSSSLTAEEGFAKDRPLVRGNLLHKSYLIFHDSSTVEFNTGLVTQKIEFIKKLNVPLLSNLIELIIKMTDPINERIGLEELEKESDNLQGTQNKNTTAIEGLDYETPNQTVIPSHQYQQYIKQDNSIRQQDITNSALAKKNVISQTTIATVNAASAFDSKVLDLGLTQSKWQNVTIPKQKLMTQIKCNYKILEKLQKIIHSLQSNANLVKKEYYDNSIYYGQVDTISQKRTGLGIYVYTHGDIYFGGWQENSLIDGTYIFKNGQSYEGVVKNGKQGFGRYYYLNGNVYEGEWKDDLKSGKGKMTYPNGDNYQGMWSKGKKNGQGIYFYNNGTLYQGNFANGKKSGFGVITFPNKTKIEAYWQQTHIEGPGKVFYNNGNYFQGNYHLSQKQGQGLYIWEQTKYEGEFKKDTMEGQARVKFSENQYYEGRIKNGKRQGHGIYRYENGDQFRGEWKNDQKMIGKYTFSEGGSFDGRFKKNEMNYGVMVYENGESYEGEFANGERNGIGSYRSALGELLHEGKWLRDQFASEI